MLNETELNTTMSKDELLKLHPLPWTHHLLLIKDANGQQVIHTGGLHSERGRPHEGRYLSGLNALLVELVNTCADLPRATVGAKWDKSGLKEACQRGLAMGRTHQEFDLQLLLDMLLEIERLDSTPRATEGEGIVMIAAERRRQLEKEGWTPEHDDHHTDQSLAQAAACYAWPPMRPIEVKKAWPWKPREWKPELHAIDADENELIEARIRVLAKAGALVAAEIDRLRRTWAKSRESKGEKS